MMASYPYKERVYQQQRPENDYLPLDEIFGILDPLDDILELCQVGQNQKDKAYERGHLHLPKRQRASSLELRSYEQCSENVVQRNHDTGSDGPQRTFLKSDLEIRGNHHQVEAFTPKKTQVPQRSTQSETDCSQLRKMPPQKLSKAPAFRNLSSRWTETEETILEGVVTDCHLIFGIQTTWDVIYKFYETASEKFCMLHRVKIGPKRTACGLKKHYRVMHNRIRTGEICKMFWYNAYHKIWMGPRYNKDQQLVDYNSRKDKQ